MEVVRREFEVLGGDLMAELDDGEVVVSGGDL